MILCMSKGATTTLPLNSENIRKQEENGTEKSGGKKKLAKSFGVALSIFLALNVIPLFVSDKSKPVFNKFDHPCKGSVWYLIDDVRKDEGNWDFATLGSSLMVAAVTNADATGLKQNIDLTTYHKAAYLDKVLNGNTRSFNLAVAGEMPSDAYLILKASIDKLKPGATLVYGLAPRDFIDHDFKSPTDSEAYQLLHRIDPLEGNLSDKYNISVWEKLGYQIEKSLYMSDNAIDIQSNLAKLGDAAVNKIFGNIDESRYPNTKRFWDRVNLIPSYKMVERIPDAFILEPENLNKEPVYVDNSLEYAMRYRRPDMKAFENQFYFLSQINALCQNKKINLVLVNMPITQTNEKLLQAGLYQTYLNKLIEFASRNQVRFLDFNNHSEFKNSDFNDGVHMNARGSMKFIEKLAAFLGNKEV